MSPGTLRRAATTRPSPQLSALPVGRHDLGAAYVADLVSAFSLAPAYGERRVSVRPSWNTDPVAGNLITVTAADGGIFTFPSAKSLPHGFVARIQAGGVLEVSGGENPTSRFWAAGARNP